jgi:hypothetical protein
VFLLDTLVMADPEVLDEETKPTSCPTTPSVLEVCVNTK